MILRTPDLGPPEDYEWIGYGMSNLFFTVDLGIEERLRTEKVWCQYSGWNFNGYVWLDAEGAFSCQVWCHHEAVATVRAESLHDLMHAVSDEWGYD